MCMMFVARVQYPVAFFPLLLAFLVDPTARMRMVRGEGGRMSVRC